jgi:hypothetical protein
MPGHCQTSTIGNGVDHKMLAGKKRIIVVKSARGLFRIFAKRQRNEKVICSAKFLLSLIGKRQNLTSNLKIIHKYLLKIHFVCVLGKYL